MDGVLSVIEKDGLQVVVGPGVCNKLCAAINEILSVDRAASTAAPDAPDVPEEKKKRRRATSSKSSATSSFRSCRL